MIRHPWISLKAAVRGTVLPGLNTTKLAREAFFCAHTPESDVVRCASRLQEESPKALLETMMPNRLNPERVKTPLLVIGAKDDGGVSMKEVLATALAYRTEAEFFPDMGHDIMPDGNPSHNVSTPGSVFTDCDPDCREAPTSKCRR
jgi:pimeloyl-ACP methyl ester carboxylesterase